MPTLQILNKKRVNEGRLDASWHACMDAMRPSMLRAKLRPHWPLLPYPRPPLARDKAEARVREPGRSCARSSAVRPAGTGWRRLEPRR